MKNFLNSLLIVVVLAVGCSKENLNTTKNSTAEVNFSLIPVEFGAPLTRAGVLADENTIKDLWILQFDGTTENSLLIKSEYITGITDPANTQIVLNQGVNHRVIFIANTFDPLLFDGTNAPLNTYTYSQFKGKTISLATESDIFTGSGTSYLRMYGLYEGDLPNKSESVLLYRICAKINLTYTSEDVSSVTDGVRFKINSVQLKNVPTTYSYISNPSNDIVLTPASVTDYPVTSGSLTGAAGEAYNIGDYSGYVTYYFPENIAGINSSVTSQFKKSLYAPAKATWLEIKGEGIGNDGRLNEYATFKFYLGNNLTDNYNVNSNTSYNISIRFKGVDVADMRMEVIRISDIEIFQEEEWL